MSMQAHTQHLDQPRVDLRRAGLKSLGALLLSSLKVHWIFFGLVIVYIAIAEWVVGGAASSAGYGIMALSYSFVAISLPLLLVSIAVLRFGRMLLFVRPKRPLAAFAADFKQFVLAPGRLANGLPVMIAMSLFVSSFMHVKAEIPALAPFNWDETFMMLDKFLHFGLHPWEILQPALGYPLISFMINFFYNLWFVVMWGLSCWLGFAKFNSQLRLQYFIAFLTTWMIGGSLLAVIFSSAGPAYYGALGLSPDPYTPLLSYLRDVNQIFPIWALDTQKMLWDGYTGTSDIFVGISAMPSIHNATAVLFALAAWRLNRAAGFVFAAFAGLIFIGSVHLAWHYAIDAYLGIAIALLTWWAAGRFTAWFMKTKSAREHSDALDIHASNENTSA